MKGNRVPPLNLKLTQDVAVLVTSARLRP